MTSLFALPDHISTPVKPSATRLTAGSDNLDAGRISLNDSIGAAVLALPTDDFFEHVLPPLSPVLQQFLPKIIARLQAPGIRIYDSRKPGWVAFLNKRPKSNENTHFKALVSIASGVEAAVAHVFFNSGYAKPHQLMKFSNAPNAVPKSDWRRAAHRPDGYFHLCKRQLPDCHWMDIGPTGEYKLGDSEAKVRDNTGKVLWNMYHSLRDDPQRRFAYAFSIENESMRLWFTNRAEVLMSSTFNIMKDPTYLVRFFLTFMYGTRADCGWDPTMEYIPHTANPLQYYITVNDSAGNTKVYKTVELESSIGAEALRGRGTRVWKAVAWDPTTFTEIGKPVALKDCWVDQLRTLEGDVIRNLDKLTDERISALERELVCLTSKRDVGPKNDILEAKIKGAERSLNAARALKASLLVPIIHGVVTSPISGAKDSTLFRKTAFVPEARWEYIFQQMKQGPEGDKQRENLQQQLKGEHRSVFDYANIRRELIQYDSKDHYRIVYGEVCRPLYRITRLDHIFDHLCYILLALEGLHEAGWVHRDISPGNILITETDSVKLSDWEYAKEFDAKLPIVHDIRTGTIDFMAIEVEKGDYLFFPSLPEQISEDDDSAEILQKPTAAPEPSERIPWNYNPLHDLESVLWLNKFFTENTDVVFVSKGKNSAILDAESTVLDVKALEDLGIERDESEALRVARLTKQHNYAQKLFHHSDGRSDAILTARIHPQQWFLHPELAARRFYKKFEAMRAALHSQYVAVEDGFAKYPPTPFTFDSWVYRSLRSALRSLSASVAVIPAYIHVVPLAPAVMRSENAHKSTQFTQPEHRRMTVPVDHRAPSINVVFAADRQVDTPPTPGDGRQQSDTLAPLAAGSLRPQSRTESRTGSRSESRAAASRPVSRTGPRPVVSRARGSSQGAVALAAGTSSSASRGGQRGTVTQTRPPGTFSSGGNARSRATTPTPIPTPARALAPAPANTNLRAQLPSAAQSKSTDKGKQAWRP